MSKPDIKVVDIPLPAWRDPATMLRNLADQIDAGDFGGIGSIGVVLLGDKFEMFGGGMDSDAPSINLLFAAAQHRFAKALEEHGQ